MLALPAAASAEQPLTDAEEGEAAADEMVLTLEQLVELACKHNPDIAIARAQRDAARGQLIQAGLYLNPTFSWEAEDLNHVGKAAGKQGPIIGQEVITARKRRIAQAAAAAGVSAADWQALTRWYEVLTRTRSAYYDLLTGRQAVQASEEIVGLARDNLAAAQKLLKAGAGVQPDVLRAQVELDQSIVQQNVAQQRLTAAGQVLASVVGVAQLKASDVQGAFPAEVPGYTWETAIATVLSRSSMVQQAQALVSQAEELHQLARAQRWPNVRLSVRPFWDFPDERYETTVIIGAPLPIFNRNQGNILSAEADLARAHEEVRQVELRLRERLAGAFQRYESARREVEVYSKQVLPNARESLRLIRIGYEKGDPKYDFNALQQAQRTVAQARLLYVQAQGELWRAVSEIAGLLQEDAPMRDCLNP
jgi:cobalt-zinc-cadmium efflux system outer membrane protein